MLRLGVRLRAQRNHHYPTLFQRKTQCFIPRRMMATSVQKQIGTHNGTFHADEALACWLLKRLDEYKTATIVRSRDPAVLEKMDVLVDVGGVYDHEKRRYDHHQSTFHDTFDNNHSIRLSSAGLVYKHYGRDVIATELGISDKNIIDILYYKLYDQFIEEIDAIDNGVDMYDPEIKPKYKITTDVASRVARLNPAWNEPSTPQIQDAQFLKAMELIGGEFKSALDYYGKSWLPAREIVEKAMKERFTVHPSGEIILLDSFCPWKDHLFTIEQEMGLKEPNQQIKYVLFCDSLNSWRVQCVPVRSGSFENRLSLPAAWRGKRDDELSALSGIPDCIFVHATGFIGGNKTKEGALQMAIKSLESK